MKYLNRKEFSAVLGVDQVWTYKAKDFPKCCKTVPRGRGTPTMYWSESVVKEFSKDFLDLDYAKVKELNDKGVHRKKIAKLLGVTAKAVGIFCRRNNIVSMSTKANRRKEMNVQTGLFPTELKGLFNVFIHAHRKATPSLRV